MDISLSKRRMGENEAVFRKRNERVQHEFEQLKKIAADHNQEHFVASLDTPLYYICECSDENCRDRVRLPLKQYSAIHKHRNRFVVQIGHETELIERVLETLSGYSVVEKMQTPSENVTKLQSTPVDNS